MPKPAWNARTPPAAVQVRVALEVARQHGLEFDEAWDAALTQVVWAQWTPDRRAEKDAINATKGAWRRAYRRQEVPGGPVLLTLLDALEDYETRTPLALELTAGELVAMPSVGSAQRPCAVCGEPIPVRRNARAKYCSPRCQSTAGSRRAAA